jgi:hypothetical protein
MTRIDAGLGLWLRGDGSGRFVPKARRSGIRSGEQRGAAWPISTTTAGWISW